MTLENPTLRNDSILSFTYAGVVGVATEDVGILEVRRFSVLRSIGLGFLALGVANAGFLNGTSTAYPSGAGCC